jgi:hypothetical protein
MIVGRSLQRCGHLGDHVVPADVIFTRFDQVEERQALAVPLFDPADLEQP